MDNCQTWQFWDRQLSDLTVFSGQLSELTVFPELWQFYLTVVHRVLTVAHLTVVWSDSCPGWQMSELTDVRADSCPSWQLSELTDNIWQLSANPFIDQNHPQNPQKDTLGTQIGPRKVIFCHFACFWYFYLIFFEHSLSTGRIFQMARTLISLSQNAKLLYFL